MHEVARTALFRPEDKRAADYNPNAVLKGAELLGRHLAMFTDEQLIEQKAISAEPMSVDEWVTKHGVAASANT